MTLSGFCEGVVMFYHVFVIYTTCVVLLFSPRKAEAVRLRTFRHSRASQDHSKTAVEYPRAGGVFGEGDL